MRTTLTLLLITVTTFSGVPGELEVIKQTPVVIQPPSNKNKTDSLEAKYYEAIAIRDKDTDKLIEEKKKSDVIIYDLKAKIKKLKKEIYCHCRDTIYIHDTMFKKRKFLQLFKN